RAERAGDRLRDPHRPRGGGDRGRAAPRATDGRHSMTTTVSAIIAERPAHGGKPSITYRYAGDRAVLVDYGEMVFDLTLNFFVLAVDDALRENRPEGLIETAPGFRSILVTYEPSQLTTEELLEHLERIHDGLQAEREIEIPSRVVHLPVAFDD